MSSFIHGWVLHSSMRCLIYVESLSVVVKALPFPWRDMERFTGWSLDFYGGIIEVKIKKLV